MKERKKKPWVKMRKIMKLNKKCLLSSRFYFIQNENKKKRDKFTLNQGVLEYEGIIDIIMYEKHLRIKRNTKYLSKNIKNTKNREIHNEYIKKKVAFLKKYKKNYKKNYLKLFNDFNVSSYDIEKSKKLWYNRYKYENNIKKWKYLLIEMLNDKNCVLYKGESLKLITKFKSKIINRWFTHKPEKK